MSEIKVVPPKTEYVEMKHFPLKDLKTAFVIPSFERKVDKKHLRKMVDAILTNEFYDNVFKGRRLPNKKIEVIDSQHRIQSFIIAHEQYNVQHYDFHLILYDTQNPRLVYRKLNMGKKLVAADITLALDNGGVKFFNDLREFCFHYRNDGKTGFVDVLFAWHWATVKTLGRMDVIEEILKSIDDNSIKTLKIFMSAMSATAGPLTNNPLYKMPFFRNILRIGFEKNYQRDQYVTLIRKIQQNNTIEEISNMKSWIGLKEAYDFIRVKILKEKLK